MASFLREHSTSTIASVALHAAIVGAMTLGIDFESRPRASLPTGEPIEAVMVDEATVQREIDRIEAREREAIAAREAEERRAREAAEEARRAQELEQQRLDALERERVEAEIEARERENARRIQLEREETERLERERVAEQERQRLAELERQREEAERQRLEEERRRQEEEARLAAERAAEEERRRREAEEAARKQAELERELAVALATEEESRRAREAGLLDEYIRNIENQIQQRWIRPPSARPGLECVVNVTQIPSGDVTSVSIGRCNGDDAVVRSIEAAVQRASPLPRPPVPSLFNRNLVITFKPDN